MPRADLSDQLIHFTQGPTDEAAYERLCTIITDGRLRGSDFLIFNSYRCVCFTEAPLAVLANGLVNNWDYGRYAPFGLIFDKRWLYARGARPVIYQPLAEAHNLPGSHQWRHMTYEPNADQPVDFSWEREWRLHADELAFNASCTGIVVPDTSWEQRMRAEHEADQDWNVVAYSQIMDSSLAEQYREPFRWTITSLRES